MYAGANPVNFSDPTGSLPSFSSMFQLADDGVPGPDDDQQVVGGGGGSVWSAGGGRLGQNSIQGGLAAGARITLRYVAGMYRPHFLRKVRALQELAAQGSLIKVSNVSRDPQVTRAYKSNLIQRVWQQYAHNPEFRDSAIRRIRSSLQADHIHELQLGGADTWQNLQLMHSFTNWNVGSQQIWQQIRNLPSGTLITGIDIGP